MTTFDLDKFLRSLEPDLGLTRIASIKPLQPPRVYELDIRFKNLPELPPESRVLVEEECMWLRVTYVESRQILYVSVGIELSLSPDTYFGPVAEVVNTLNDCPDRVARVAIRTHEGFLALALSHAMPLPYQFLNKSQMKGFGDVFRHVLIALFVEASRNGVDAESPSNHLASTLFTFRRFFRAVMLPDFVCHRDV